MAGELLLDTGALVSLLDRSQPHHRRFTEFFSGWRGAVVSTEAVLTEATHLLGRTPGGRELCLEFFLAGGATLVPASLSTLRRCRVLVERYADLPMDYADATLVILAEDLRTDLVFTTDRRDFEVYRFGRNRPFQVLPSLI
ncbi:MAG TPA: PIN domain-containing protein [Thermoanaerobaculia bacterium]|nr:PIN domain-containing protein [Thermoanaerobaculia bacterium]